MQKSPFPIRFSRSIFRRSVRRAARAFTMMELLVVLGILALLAGLAIQNFGGIFNDAKKQAAQLFVTQTVKTGLFSYQFKMGDYPSTSEGIMALMRAPEGKAGSWGGPYLDGNKTPLDPWQEPYQYAWPGKHNKDKPDVWSKGPDKTDGTADDIGNWDASAEAPK